jgi:hypothetical protein
MTPPLDAVAASAIDFVETFAVLGRVNVIVCGSRVTSNETLYKSDAR